MIPHCKEEGGRYGACRARDTRGCIGNSGTKLSASFCCSKGEKDGRPRERYNRRVSSIQREDLSSPGPRGLSGGRAKGGLSLFLNSEMFGSPEARGDLVGPRRSGEDPRSRERACKGTCFFYNGLAFRLAGRGDVTLKRGTWRRGSRLINYKGDAARAGENKESLRGGQERVNSDLLSTGLGLGRRG